MISLILLVVSFLLFLIAGFNGTLFTHSGLSLVAFGLAAGALSALLSGVGPKSPWMKGQTSE